LRRRKVQWLVILVQADIKRQAYDKMVQKEDLLRLVAKHEMIPTILSFV
jgi:hypothetical protein